MSWDDFAARAKAQSLAALQPVLVTCPKCKLKLTQRELTRRLKCPHKGAK